MTAQSIRRLSLVVITLFVAWVVAGPQHMALLTAAPADAADPALEAAISSYLVSHGFRYTGDCSELSQPHPFDAKICSMVTYQTDGSADVLLGLPFADGGWHVLFVPADDGWAILSDEGSWTVPGDTARTVASFYRSLQERAYPAAYGFLSAGMQASMPYDAWRAGYLYTVRFCYRVTAAPYPTSVAVELSSLERGAGGIILSSFHGTWDLIWDAFADRWLLDAAHLSRTFMLYCPP